MMHALDKVDGRQDATMLSSTGDKLQRLSYCPRVGTAFRAITDPDVLAMATAGALDARIGGAVPAVRPAVRAQLEILRDHTKKDDEWDLAAKLIRKDRHKYSTAELEQWAATLCEILRNSSKFGPDRVVCAVGHLELWGLSSLRVSTTAQKMLVKELVISSGSVRDGRPDVRAAAASVLKHFNVETAISPEVVGTALVAIDAAGTPDAGVALIRWLAHAHSAGVGVSVLDDIATGMVRIVGNNKVGCVREAAVDGLHHHVLRGAQCAVDALVSALCDDALRRVALNACKPLVRNSRMPRHAARQLVPAIFDAECQVAAAAANQAAVAAAAMQIDGDDADDDGGDNGDLSFAVLSALPFDDNNNAAWSCAIDALCEVLHSGGADASPRHVAALKILSTLHERAGLPPIVDAVRNLLKKSAVTPVVTAALQELGYQRKHTLTRTSAEEILREIYSDTGRPREVQAVAAAERYGSCE